MPRHGTRVEPKPEAAGSPKVSRAEAERCQVRLAEEALGAALVWGGQGSAGQMPSESEAIAGAEAALVSARRRQRNRDEAGQRGNSRLRAFRHLDRLGLRSSLPRTGQRTWTRSLCSPGLDMPKGGVGCSPVRRCKRRRA